MPQESLENKLCLQKQRAWTVPSTPPLAELSSGWDMAGGPEPPRCCALARVCYDRAAASWGDKSRDVLLPPRWLRRSLCPALCMTSLHPAGGGSAANTMQPISLP